MSVPYGQFGKEEYLGRPGYDALAQAFGGMMNITGDPSGPPQRAKTFTGDYLTALTGWAATMMALWEVKKTGRGQVVDLAQFEAVAQTQGNCMPLFTGQGTMYGHTGNRAPGFQPYDTFKCRDGWVYIGAVGGAIYAGCRSSSDSTLRYTVMTPARKMQPQSIQKKVRNSIAYCDNIALTVRAARWRPP